MFWGEMQGVFMYFLRVFYILAFFHALFFTSEWSNIEFVSEICKKINIYKKSMLIYAILMQVCFIILTI